ncbi:cytochrome P450 [Apiospora phragmitis]|uniref:Cytochrome P450 n=1 Tax=Apiospora phragmitis TaxID=2905665 RepID=A0ABR1WTW8_9PEZI
MESCLTDIIGALHSVLLREREVAEKGGRRPDYFKRAIADEFFGFTMVGHDTTATATAWGAKYLTDHPAVQETLRTALRKALPDAASQRRSPTYPELSKAHVPYLDAVVEEATRHANTAAFVARKAMQDTTVLGRRIPKGTDVLLMANGPGYLEPNMRIEDKSGDENAMVRSPGARPDGGKSLTGLWDDADIGAFKSERWLKTDPETGTERFDPMAGPNLAFGAGLRGCFGK